MYIYMYMYTCNTILQVIDGRLFKIKLGVAF